MFCVAGISVIHGVLDNLWRRKADESASGSHMHAATGQYSGAHEVVGQRTTTRIYHDAIVEAAARTAAFRTDHGEEELRPDLPFRSIRRTPRLA